MARRKTHEEFVAEVKALVGDEYTVVGAYINAKTPISMFHKRCNDTSELIPDNFLGKKQTRCKKCSKAMMIEKAKKPHELFIENVKYLVGQEYTVLTKYNGVSNYVSMKHNTCGHEYPVRAGNFLNGRRCPECANEVRWDTRGRVTTEIFSTNINNRFNGEFEVVGEYINSETPILMRHKACDNTRLVVPSSFYSNGGCPHCFVSKGEQKIEKWLNDLGIPFESQFPIKVHKKRRVFKLDFLVQNVALEYDGEYHYKPMPHAGGEEGLHETQRRDAIKTQYCADNGIPLIRIPYWDFDNIDAILTEKLLPLLMETNVA